MRRRAFLKALALLAGAPLVRLRTQQEPIATYTDSDGNPPAALLTLADKQRAAGGVTYQG